VPRTPWASSTRSGSSSARPLSARHSVLQKALGYLIGEKLVNFLRAADEDPAFAGELPRFMAEITQVFDRAEIETYLDTVHRVGALGHVSSDEAYEEMREAGAIDEDPVEWAEEILFIERAAGAAGSLRRSEALQVSHEAPMCEDRFRSQPPWR
jgi:hypothetical protein